MKNFRGRSLIEALILISIVIALVVLGSFLSDLRKMARIDNLAMAAVTNPTTASPGYMMVNIPLVANSTEGNYGMGTKTNKVRFKMPWPATLLGVSGIYRTGGAPAGMTIDVLEAGTSCLSVPLVINSTTAAEGVITDSAIADEAMIGITTVVTTATALYDPMVQLIFKRK